jgi:uncharacterized protein with von Willebrand factor type A (vWA) domain
MQGLRFSAYKPVIGKGNASFDSLLSLFQQLLLLTSGDVTDALSYLTQIDQKYKITGPQYGIGDFIEDLKSKGFITDTPGEKGAFSITPKTERGIRKSALEEIFGKLKKSKRGDHATTHTGQGEELTADKRAYTFGDTVDSIDMTASLRNAQIHHGLQDFSLYESDLEVIEKESKSTTSTVLMIDISHSMILYGEDRITPAKKVALALAELITTKYPKDTLDILVFGNDAWQIQIKDLTYLQVGPYHTNTIAGLELAMDILRRKKTANKQIFMITDGKPTCMKVGVKYYKNSFGIDSKILNKTLNLGAQLKRMHIPVTTFMIASDPYLKQFVQEFTRVNDGQAYYSGLQGLGHLVFEDYKRNRRKNL